MNIDGNTEFGSLEPLMLQISEHLKTDPDPKTNGSRYNKVWSLIFDFIKDRASAHRNLYERFEALRELYDLLEQEGNPLCEIKLNRRKQ